ncbi:hypothetical protein QUF95_24615 [Paenibacillus silvae]|uniref:hypothetical protein n=1 Tax=Paenibacillus silvae TaxID=1325358 RepID=UPI0025A27107|nr:hypothetical protein [Paenibacillus silvae]MDM5280542.1 hypothetical protein [Paenibacillus silvae]
MPSAKRRAACSCLAEGTKSPCPRGQLCLRAGMVTFLCPALAYPPQGTASGAGSLAPALAGACCARHARLQPASIAAQHSCRRLSSACRRVTPRPPASA